MLSGGGSVSSGVDSVSAHSGGVAAPRGGRELRKWRACDEDDEHVGSCTRLRVCVEYGANL